MVIMEKQLSMTLYVLKTCMFVEITVGKSVMVYVSRWLMKVSVELFCPTRGENNDQRPLNYVSYGLVTDKTIKEGKAAYKKMEEIREEKTFDEFLDSFVSSFPSFSKHKLEAWLLNTLKNTCLDEKYQPCNTLFSISDFAQNLKLDKKKKPQKNIFIKLKFQYIALFPQSTQE